MKATAWKAKNVGHLKLMDQNMIPFTNFKFPSTVETRRRKMLSEVMPMGGDFTYFVLLSDAYLTFDKDERHIRSFYDLQDALGDGDDLEALQIARAEGLLTEGRHGLPDAVVGFLADAATELPQVRRWVFGDSEPIVTTVAISEIKYAWASLDFEEAEVGDPSGKWYFRTRDDEPLIFLAINDEPLSSHIRRCKEFCREVTGEFLYTL